jgi:hypothetical protein
MDVIKSALKKTSDVNWKVERATYGNAAAIVSSSIAAVVGVAHPAAEALVFGGEGATRMYEEAATHDTVACLPVVRSKMLDARC